MTYRTDGTIRNGFGQVIPISKNAKVAFEEGKWLTFDKKLPFQEEFDPFRTQNVVNIYEHIKYAIDI